MARPEQVPQGNLYRYYEFEVSLVDIEPPIRRRFLLSTDGTTFGDLHAAIQDAGPWKDDHMFAFYRDKRCGEPIAGVEDDEYRDGELPGAGDVPLSGYWERKGQKCFYLYDFGDSWMHKIELKQIVDSPEKFTRRLLDGARAWPYEDSGGVGGYYAMLEAKQATEADLEKEENEYLLDYLEWAEDWDPEEFDLKKRKKDFDE